MQHVEQRRKNLHYAVSCMPQEGYILEFGVGAGHSLKLLSEIVAPRKIYAFDSFEGLPEDWLLDKETGLCITKGKWATKKPPKEYSNVKYVIGLFADVLPIWKTKQTESIAFIHIDSDLYSSATTILTELEKQIVPGTIIVFDEIYESPIYKEWRSGEYKAFAEWQQSYSREVVELYKTDFGEATFRILK